MKMLGAKRMSPIVLPIAHWRDANSKLKERLKEHQQSTKKKKKRKKGLWIRRFTLSLKDEKFITFHIQHVSNLFFEFASATKENVSSDYFIVQMDEEDLGAKEREELSEERTFFGYDVDPFRESILRNGITAAEVSFNFIGCSKLPSSEALLYFPPI